MKPGTLFAWMMGGMQDLCFSTLNRAGMGAKNIGNALNLTVVGQLD
jgi:hypothetical protein